MFNSILVALEGGDASRQALCMAVDMARAAHAKITALFVIEHHLAIGDVILGCSEEQIFREFMHEEAEHELRRAEELFTARGLEGETLMIDAAGEPVADVICRAVVSAKADLVVLGRHDPTVLEKIFGSLADKVLNKTAVSVLVVGSGAELSDT
ncbi:universal stress protein [Paraburkholderia terrae]|uniref:Universal stress protein n=1 Tax=Paraburkholderia terrae TaxID=311230 RepID=A0ABM7U1V4_9BURK|nr:universal stress protein [Paraburkholderia terrae]BCZ85115.1 universal stress protein [Paraburkholderia terrae]